MKRIRPVHLYLLLLLLCAAGLRIWYMTGDPSVDRFEDERYSLQNVRKIYFTGDFEPASGYYPSPVFNWPQVALLKSADLYFESVGDTEPRTFKDNGQLQPLGFLLTRSYQTFCGVLSVWLVFLIGRRLFDESVGCVAATIFAFLPWTLHSSGYNKPDALLVLGVCASFWASLRAMDTGKMRDYVLAGLGIALAMSAKLTGGLMAVPLMVGTLFYWNRPRRLAGLALAGITSAAAFVLTNPYWKAYLHFIRGLQRDYSGRTEESRWAMPVKVVDLHLGPSLFGPVLGTVVLLAVIALAAYWLRRRGPAEDQTGRVRLAMLLAFPPIYTLTYAIQTSYFKPNNFLPLVPLSCAAGAWGLVGLWRWAVKASGLAGSRHRLLLNTVAVILAAILMVPRGFAYVYESRVPTTYDLGRWVIENNLKPGNGRLIYQDPPDSGGLPWEGQRFLHRGLSAVADIHGQQVLEDPALGFDALVIRHPSADEARRRLLEELVWTETIFVEPSPFEVRGPALAVAYRKSARSNPTEVVEPTPCGLQCLEAVVPLSDGEEHWSFFIRLPSDLGVGASEAAALEIDGRTLPLHWASKQKKGHLYVTPRVPAPKSTVDDPENGDGVPVRLVAAGESRLEDWGEAVSSVVLQIQRWPPR